MGCEKVRSNFWIFRKFKNYFKTGTLVLAILAMLTWLLTIFAAKNPETVEKLYSSTVYPYIAKSIGLIFGIFPISIAEIIIIIIFVLVLTGLLFLLFSPKKILDNKKLIINKIISCTSLVYILFYFLWGFNYYRQEYSVLADMDTDLGTLEELFELSLEIINNLNEIRYNLLEDESGVFYVTENIRELSRQAQKGFEDLWIGTINLSGNYGHVKPILLSGFMSYTGITGIYFPFTFEPNVNMDIPHHNLLATICHEIAHQRGFAKEDEANFIA